LVEAVSPGEMTVTSKLDPEGTATDLQETNCDRRIHHRDQAGSVRIHRHVLRHLASFLPSGPPSRSVTFLGSAFSPGLMRLMEMIGAGADIRRPNQP